jgi:hypothetical protein
MMAKKQPKYLTSLFFAYPIIEHPMIVTTALTQTKSPRFLNLSEEMAMQKV